jgi:hypothetical protein
MADERPPNLAQLITEFLLTGASGKDLIDTDDD